MNSITVFTSNQPRHLSLIQSLGKLAKQVFVVQECTTVFPGQVEDFYRKTEVMQDYFARVIAAEKNVFGGISFNPSSARTLSLRMGDLSSVGLDILAPVLDTDLCIVFGSSWIRGPLIDALIERRAINLHMGLSPYYRGTACNFWSMYDGKYEFVGGTIHLLSKGLDSGDILTTIVPPLKEADPFDFGMLAVKSTHDALAKLIADGSILDIPAVRQDRSLEIRYTRNRDFTDEIAREYLARMPTSQAVIERRRLKCSDTS
jgi:Formyl transferase